MNKNNNRMNDLYDESVKRLKNADRYSRIGESEYSRERSNPYEMVDYMIDHDLQINRSQSHQGKGPRNYQKTDARLYEEVCEILLRDPMIDARDIEVAVQNGEVELSGTVDSRGTKRMAELAIDGLTGIKDISNKLQIVRVGE